ncbi:vWA domain-containing protein [Planctomycetes bacterium TBK1r]|uniref:von Willebrand factor type A domain protein n=1 Tax=Stieleria magnilauensis TaxID=2527963 RepID=A0ABX5XPL5_9BACT|nr:von Willebrand factor type A domain protein [Planctomycetes bacterium TBK1r]
MFVRFSKLSVVVGWLLSGLLASNAAADSYPEIMLILDSSGSMSEVVAGKQKIVAAKEVMHEVVPQLDENIRVGLTAYGHRRAGDCTDIETLIPAGSNDRQELLSKIDHLQPKGRTPISSAILSVANQLKMKDAETTIILVSDGIETCGGDPCQVVAQLNATGVKFVLHVVGFDVDASAAQQLQCLAEQGRGRYFPAADAAELLKALQEVSAEVLQKVQQVDPAKVSAKAARSGLGKLRVTMPIGSEVSLKNLKIGNPESGDVKRTVEGPKSDGTYPLLSGTYFVSLGFATPSYGRPTESSLGEVTISKGETRRLSLGSISFNIAKELEEKIAVEEVLITDAGTNHVVARVRKNGNTYYHFKPKPMVAGVYDIQFEWHGHKPKLLWRNGFGSGCVSFS